MGLLSPEGLAKTAKGKSDGHRAWAKRLEAQLAALQTRTGESSNLGALIGFVRHRLRYGGAKKQNLAHLTLGSVTRFSSELLAVAAGGRIVDWSEDEFLEAYMTVLLRKGERARRQAFDALVDFHEFLTQVHQAPLLSFAELERVAGKRLTFRRIGLPSDNERDAVFSALIGDLESERARPDVSPEWLRCLELRVVNFLVLDAAGLRPRSAHGLTLGDVILLGPGIDFVRVRTTGEFGSAKSHRSTGFVPLQGHLWTQHRERIEDWLQRERSLVASEKWWSLPLFANAPGSRRRFTSATLTRRIDELMKWATGDPKASTYWLRKGRVSARHSVAANESPPTARGVHAALCWSGHADIYTPMASYVGEPAVVMSRQIGEGGKVSRKNILDITGLPGPPLDVAWMRHGGADSEARIPTVFRRLHCGPSGRPQEQLSEPPPLRQGGVILPIHVDAYARALQQTRDRHEAVHRAGLTFAQADRLDECVRQLLRRKGKIPWAPPGLLQSGSVMIPPRALAGTQRLFALLRSEPEPFLEVLAEAWVSQGHLASLHGSDALVVLEAAADRDAFESLLAATGLDLATARDASVEIVRPRQKADGVLGHAMAFRWVLALAWIYRQAVQTQGAPN